MSEQKRVSVAMCTYNGARFLRQQLDSFLAQTSLPDELVVCDDGSTDETGEMVHEFARHAPFEVRLVVNEERLRFAQNFAKCIGLCRGDIVVLTDQDDIWVSTRIQDTRDAYDADPNLLFTYSDAPLIDGEGVPTGEHIYSRFPVHRRDRKRIHAGSNLLPAISRWGFIYGCTMTFRANMRKVVLPVPHGWSHDEWLTLALSSVGPSRKLRPQTNYRQHGVNSVGVGDWTHAGKMRMAQSRDAEAYAGEITRVLQGYEVAASNDVLRVTLAPTLERKIAFLRKRQAARQSGLRGAGLIARILASGGYKRYGAGPKSIVKDLAVITGWMK